MNSILSRVSLVHGFTGSFLVGLIIYLNAPSKMIADEISARENPLEEPVRQAKFYRSPEERREAGLGTPITGWLTFYGLFEAEYEYSKIKYKDGGTLNEDFDTEAIQIGLEAEFTEWLFAEFVLEVEYDRKQRTLLDEGLIALEFDTWALKAGIQNLDFGEYYSHFVTGPLLEFGETRKWTLTGEKELSEFTDLMAYTFESEGMFAGGDLGWGVALEWVSEDESIRVGSGYMSDLRQSDDFFGEEDYANPTRVPGWNMFALVGFDSFELTAEVVAATSHFQMEDNRMRPRSYNLELAYFLNYDFQIATRLEYSKDLVDEPEWQSGLSITWLLGNHLILSFDYLHGSFESPQFFEEEEVYFTHRNLIAAQVGFEF
ncbi:MAG: LbtU family siderophore porin [Verrucomicrobia bacterium]|nr:LbtU family siderophore porin [Verrucomicrobiota bacterium]